MGMKEALPFLGMVSVQFIQVAQIVAVKEATSNGMSKFTFVFYSNAIASLVLLPTSFLLHRSTRPPITFSLLCKFFVLGLLGFTSQVIGNAAVQITPASFCSAILNLVPGFTFVLAVIFRMEEADFRSSSTLAKSIGTLVLILGALIVTLYKGPSLLMTPTHSNPLHQLLTEQYNLVLGGFLFIINCMAISAYTITQAFLLKKFGAELIVVFFYCFFITILSAIFSLFVERDPAAWSLQPPIKLLSILFSGIVASAIQVSISAWCLHQRGPIFISVFHPLGIVISTTVGIIFLGDYLYLGSVVGSIVIVLGFYSVMWGKSKEQKLNKDNGVSSSESTSEKAPLLQNIKETQV